MSETYVECLVKPEPPLLPRFLRIVLIMLTVVFGVLTLLGIEVALIVAVLTGVGAYFAHLYAEVEYEYLYLDKEISVDQILAQTRRKKVATFEVERIEILAPLKSYRLDNYKNRTCKEIDYSVRKEEQPDRRYVMYYEGNQKIILSPSEEMIKAIKNVAPRKVFTD